MTTHAVALFLYTETSLHVGVGSTVSVIDLPIQRERTTQYPIVQGSGVKGAIRSQIGADDDTISTYFGGEVKGTGNGDKRLHAGAMSFGDARIVLFPVRSLAGVFAYTTCPAVLARVRRDIPSFPALTQDVTNDAALIATGVSSVNAGSSTVVLEEYSFNAKAHADVDAIADWLTAHALPQDSAYEYWRDKLKGRLVVLSDDAFRDFVHTSTEVTTRVRLDKGKKTVADGALWTQESLPADSLLMSAVIARGVRDGQSTSDAAAVAGWIKENKPSRIQLGGDETTGSGVVALTCFSADKAVQS